MQRPLDETDRRIIDVLRRDGRASYASIGNQVGLSPHGAADRIRRLRETGIITGFTATVDLNRLGAPLEALVDVRLQSTTSPEEFEAAAGELPAIRDLSFVTGRFDYHVRVACRDTDDLNRTVRALRRIGAAYTETRIVMRSRSWNQPLGTTHDTAAVG